MAMPNWKDDPQREAIKDEIKRIFDANVRGRLPSDLDGMNHHDGGKGHWLQVQFGLSTDNANAPDFKGFELKDDTTAKTTFGDWSADGYIFFSHQGCIRSLEKASRCSKCQHSSLSRSEFLNIFGTPNPRKQGRQSWSGLVFPKIQVTNEFGQSMRVNEDLSVEIRYSFSADLRTEKIRFVPDHLRNDCVILARWNANSLRNKLESKFRKHGWFKCVQENRGKGRYVGVKFGGPIDYEYWIEQVKEGIVFLDSGMYEGNPRPYASWRASNSFWDTLVEETYF